MPASVVTGSGIVIAHVDVVAAAPIIVGDDTSTATSNPTGETSTTTDRSERTSTPTTQYPAPVPPERVVTPTTQYPAPTSTTSVIDGADSSTTVETSSPATSTTELASSPAATETTVDAGAVASGLAPVPGAIDSGGMVASGGPVPTSSVAISGSASSVLPTTGQSMDVPVMSGVGLALIGAALLRLRRRPSWD